MAADFTFDYFLAVDNAGNPIKSATFTLYAAAAGGSASPMYDMNGSPIASVTTSTDGVGPRFRADIDQGYLDNGTIRLPIASTAVMNSRAQATAAQASAANSATSAANSATAAQQAAAAAQGAQTSGIAGAPAIWPTTFPPSPHTHTSGQVSDSTALGRAVLTAADAATARAVIGAGTGNGTSDLTLGTTSTTAAAGNHTHAASGIAFTPTGSVTATDVQAAIAQVALTGGGGGGSGTAVDIDPKLGGYYLDSPRYTGTDDQRLTSAIADQQASGGVTNMAPIILPNRPLAFNVARTLYSGCKIIGPMGSGQKNGELSSGNFVGPEITLGSALGSGTSSWWNGTGNVYDVFMADFTVQGSQGSSKHQFLDQPSGTLYACEFRSLSFNMMKGVFGNGVRKCLMTQVMLTGSWTMNNCWDTQINAGGSDNAFFKGGYCNLGTSASSAQTGNINTYYLIFDSLEVEVGKIYSSTLNGWRGLRILGTGSAVTMFEGVFEGINPVRINGLFEGPGPGSQVRIDGGAVSMFGTKVGQGMDNPDASETGLLMVTGGEVALNGVTFYGRNLGTAKAIGHTGGRLFAAGIMKKQDESAYWTGRPKIATTATAGAGAYTYYCPDGSLG